MVYFSHLSPLRIKGLYFRTGSEPSEKSLSWNELKDFTNTSFMSSGSRTIKFGVKNEKNPTKGLLGNFLKYYLYY